MAGFKMKTRKAAAKRFRKATGTGKIIRSKGHHGHFLSRRGQKARRNQGTTMVNESNFEQVNALVPALGAKRKRSKAIKAALRRAMAAVKAKTLSPSAQKRRASIAKAVGKTKVRKAAIVAKQALVASKQPKPSITFKGE